MINWLRARIEHLMHWRVQTEQRTEPSLATVDVPEIQDIPNHRSDEHAQREREYLERKYLEHERRLAVVRAQVRAIVKD